MYFTQFTRILMCSKYTTFEKSILMNEDNCNDDDKYFCYNIIMLKKTVSFQIKFIR